MRRHVRLVIATSIALTWIALPMRSVADGPAHPPSWVPFMRGVWYLDEPAGSVRRDATGDVAGDLIETVAGSEGPSQGPTRLIPNDTTPGEFQQGSASARWNQSAPLSPDDGHSTFLHCGRTWDDAACADRFALVGSMSMGCWTRGLDSVVHIEHRMIDHLDLPTHAGYEAVWSGGHGTGFHYGCKWWPQPAGREAVSGVSFTVPAGVWGHGVCVLDLAAVGDEGKVYTNGILSNDQPWTAPTNPPNVGFNISSHVADGRWEGELDECFIANGALTEGEVCRICSCGIDGGLCSCDAADPGRFGVAGTGRNATECAARVCVGGTDTHSVHEGGPGEPCTRDGDCPGGGHCSEGRIPCDLTSVRCDQPAPRFAMAASTTTTMTTIVVTTSTSPPICDPPDCDDGDACTIDDCVGGQCEHAPRFGFDGLGCRLTAIGTLVASAPGIAPQLQSRLAARLAGVRRTIDAAATPGRRRRRALRRAKRRILAMIELLSKLAATRRIGHPLEGSIAGLLRAAEHDVDLLMLRNPPHEFGPGAIPRPRPVTAFPIGRDRVERQRRRIRVGRISRRWRDEAWGRNLLGRSPARCYAGDVNSGGRRRLRTHG